jgi:TolB-like protein/DNA-binding winged helix-turn-helix (wHTH) protein/Tfp pilus assembly protein PilF
VVAAATPAVYRFDRFVLDLGRGTLLAGSTERTLRPKSFALLRHLVENAGRIVDRDEIMQAVWPAVYVTEDSIAQCVKEVRRALEDDRQRLLRTLPRRGYLLAADVSRGETAVVELPIWAVSVAQPPEPGWRSSTGRPMVVVLPFENIGGDPDQHYFAEGLTADLVTDLTKFQAMHVVSPHRPSLHRQLPETPWTAPPTPPGAGYAVSGSVRRAGNRVRVTVKLEDAQSGVTLWAERFDRPLDDLFAVQEELAERLASHLVSHVDHEGMRRARRRPPASLDAYDLCLRGRELHGRATEADTLAAEEMLSRAIALDPEYATAYAWQAYVVQRGFTHRWGRLRGQAAAKAALDLARRSVQIEPESPLCLARLAFILAINFQWDEALATGRAAVAANASFGETRHGYADVLVHAGDPEEGVHQMRLAIALNPFHLPTARALLGRALVLAGRPEEGFAELQFCASRLPDYQPAQQMLVAAAVESGRMMEARAALRQVERLIPGLTVGRLTENWFFRDPDVPKRLLAAYFSAGLST